MNARTKWLVMAGCALLVLGGAGAAPTALRRMDSFNVRRVEVRGTRLLAPHEVLRQSGIDASSSIFDDPTPWMRALESHPAIMSVRIERDLPATIRVLVTEAIPVALLRTPELRPIREEGLVLPIDPSAADLDLPIVLAEPGAVKDGRVIDARILGVARTLGVIRGAEPELYDWISDAASAPEQAVRLGLREPARAYVYVSELPDRGTLHQLRLTLADLSARNDLVRLARIDARFHDQIVVALRPAVLTVELERTGASGRPAR